LQNFDNQLKRILGISAYYHDSAAVLLEDGVIVAAAHEERFTRKKHDADFPAESIKFCLEYAGITLEDIDFIVFYDKPFLKFERLLETYYMTAPRGIFSFVKAIPIWLKEKLFLKSTLKDSLKDLDLNFSDKTPILFSEHHLSHAASSYFASPSDDSLILTIDGVGEWATASIAHGKGNQIQILKEMHFPDSLGLLYSAFTYFLGFKVNSGEYKLMGLAPYGDPASEETKRFKQIILDNLVQLHDDGSVKLNQDYFEYMWGLKMVREKKWQQLFGFAKRKEESPIEKHHCNLALAIQQITEDSVILMAKHALSLQPSDNICLAGGVALNCVANGKLLKENLFKDIYIQPASGDAGGALGAALAIHYMYLQNEKNTSTEDAMQHAYLGPEYSQRQIEITLQKNGLQYSIIEQEEKLTELVCNELLDGKVAGVFKGRMEFGPRALGNRSILADARNEVVQSTLNLKIKNRENFRPFAPIMLEEESSRFFETGCKSPYMLLVDTFKKEHRIEMSADIHQKSMKELLNAKRSVLPAITHIDYSARLQTVTEKSNPFIYRLLNDFKEQTGIGVLVNTSFNLRGEPVVCSPFDAIQCFMVSEMDVLILENFIVYKENQSKENIDFFRKRYVYKTD
jgi:carbamoyltransferase